VNMYTEFYGLSERPFDVSPDPKFLYLTASHRETLASMLYGIKERRGLMAVTGEVGTGKTTLINEVLNSLDEKVKTAYIYRKCTTVDEFLRAILHGFGVPVKGIDRFTLWQELKWYLLETASRRELSVLIVDEAQNLTDGMLEEIRTLSNLETHNTKLLQIILVGQIELDGKLESEELRPLRQRIVVRRKVLPLSSSEVEAYINYRLNLVGGMIYALFTRDAISLISRYSKGIPRVINILCDNAFLIGYALAQKEIDGAIIREVMKDMEGVSSPSKGIHASKASSRGQHLTREGGFLHALTRTLRSLIRAANNFDRFSCDKLHGRPESDTFDPVSQVTDFSNYESHQRRAGKQLWEGLSKP
jgi:general secretion pathway protein A